MGNFRTLSHACGAKTSESDNNYAGLRCDARRRPAGEPSRRYFSAAPFSFVSTAVPLKNPGFASVYSRYGFSNT